MQFEEIIFIGYFFMAEYMIQSHYRAQKSKMAAKIQDGGQKFWMLLTKKLDMVLKNSHTKNGACLQSVTGLTLTASTIVNGCAAKYRSYRFSYNTKKNIMINLNI